MRSFLSGDRAKTLRGSEHLQQRTRSRSSDAALSRAVIEALEIRTFLTTVSLTGDSGPTAWYIRRNGDNVQIFQNQSLNATPTVSVPVSDNDPIDLYGQSGNDSLTVDFSGGNPIYGGLHLSYTAPIGTGNSVTIENTGSADFTLASRSLTINGAGFTDSISTGPAARVHLNLFGGGGSDQFDLTGGSYVFDTDLGAAGSSVDMEVGSGATATFGVTQHLNSLLVDAGGSALVSEAGGLVLDTNTLTVNGTLDLVDNDLIVNDPSSSDMTTLQEDVVTGYPVTSGSAITAAQGSIFASDGPNDGMALGVAPEADLATPLATLDAQAVPSTALVVRYTLPGDADLDGTVGGVDLGILTHYYGQSPGLTPPAWYDGDFNYDGAIDFSDLTVLAGYFGGIGPAAPTPVTVGQTYTLSLPSDANGYPAEQWDVDWGDGQVDSLTTSNAIHTTTFYGTSYSTSHVFTNTGPVQVQVTATAQDGTIYHAAATALAITAASGLTAYHLSAEPTDAINIAADGGGNTIITDNGSAVETIPTADLLSLNITGDTAGPLTVDFSHGDPLPPSGMSTDSDQVNITGSSGSDTLFSTSTAAVFGNAEIRHPSSAALTFLNAGPGDIIAAIAGTVTIAGDTSNSGSGSPNGGPSVVVNQGATVLFTGTQHLSALDILPGGTARMVQYGSYQLVTNSLNITPYQGPPGDLPASLSATISGTDSASLILNWGQGTQTDGYFADMPGGESPGGLYAYDVPVYLAPASSGIYYSPADHGFDSTGFVPGQWVLYIDNHDTYNSWDDHDVVLEQGYDLVGGVLTPVGSCATIDLTTNSIVSGTASVSTPYPIGKTQNGFPSGGLLDLSDNDLIVHGGNLSTVAGLLNTGYDGGYWDAASTWPDPEPAAIDSTTALNDSAMLETLGYAEVGTATGDLNLSTFDALPVAAGDVIVKFTYYGDANLDGNVDSADEGIMNAGQSGWTNGDFNYDGVVNGSDYSLMDVMTNASTGQNQNVPAGTLALTAGENFPVSGLPTMTPNGDAINGWQMNWDNGDTQTFLPTDALPNPYTDSAASYVATLIPLDTNGNPEYYYPHTLINVTVAAPTQLTPQATTSTTATLFWLDPAGGSTYTVQYSTDSTFATGVSSASVTASDQGAESAADDEYLATISGLSPNENYYLRVARDEPNAPYSGVVGTVTASADGLAAPEKLTQTAYSSSQIDVAWTPYIGIGAPPWSYLLLEQSSDGITFTPALYNGTSDQIPATYSQLVVNVGSVAGSTFTFRLQAVYSNGELSAPTIPTLVSAGDSGLLADPGPSYPIKGVSRFTKTNPIDQAGWYYVSISDGTATAAPATPSDPHTPTALNKTVTRAGIHFGFEDPPIVSGYTIVDYVFTQVDLTLVSPRIWATSEMDALTRAFSGSITTYLVAADGSAGSQSVVYWPHSSLVMPYCPGSDVGGVVGISSDAEPAPAPSQPPANAPSGITYFYYSPSAADIEYGGGQVQQGFVPTPSGKDTNCPCTTKSNDPVEYSDGVFDYETTDLESDGFGSSFNITRTMVPTVTDAAVNINGWGMADTSLPYLVQDPGGWSLGIVENGTQQEWFNLNSDGATYSASYDSQSKLTPIDSAFSYQDADGNQEIFYGFGGNIPTNQQGQLESSTDESGNTVSVIYSGGDIEKVVVSNANTTGSDVYTYTYSGGLVHSIALQEVPTGPSGSLTPIIRQVVYSYYLAGAPDTYTDGDPPAAGQFGNAGDLKTAEEEDADGNDLGEQYYRYYPHIDGSGQTDRFSYIFTQQAFARLSQVLGGDSNVFAASNATVAPYASWALTYDSMDRVSTEDVSGFGASATGTLPNVGIGTFSFTYTPNVALYGSDPLSVTDFSSQSDTSPYPDVWINGSDRLDGQGAENSDFNQWVEKTVETLPDGDHNIIYTNAGGRDILSAFVPQSGPITATYNVYDQQGRLIETAEPSAINLSPSDLTEIPQVGAPGGFYNPGDAIEDGASGYDLGGPTSLINTSAGLVEITGYTTGTADDPVIGNEGNVNDSPPVPPVPAGYPESESVQQGRDASTATVTSETIYTASGSPSIYQPTQVIQPDPQEQDQSTSYAYTDNDGSWLVTQTLSASDGDEAGQGSPATDTSSVDALNDGYTVWTRDAGGIINLSLYDPVTGGLLASIDDVKMSTVGTLIPGIAMPGWSNSDASPLNLVTTYTLDGLGRPLSMTDPNGNVTYYAYLDSQHETRVYPGWHSIGDGQYTSTGPIEVYREDWDNNYTETLTYSATLSQAVPDGSDPIANLQSLDRQFMNAAGQVVSDQQFYNFNGVTYSTSPSLGTINFNYYLTTYGYDAYGRQYETTSPNGTKTEKIYDGQDRLTSLMEGTTSSTLVDVADYQYDMDGNLTSLTLNTDVPGQPARVTDYVYDWRDRQVAEVDGAGTADAVVQYTTYDNLDQPIEQQTFNGNAVSLSLLATQAPTTQLASQEVLSYDDQGRVDQDTVYVIDQATGDITGTQTTDSWYDARGDLMATEAPDGLVTEYTYDGAGRLVLMEEGSLVSSITGPITWADVSTDANLIALAGSAYSYDLDGNLIATEQMLRDAGDSTSAAGALNESDTPARVSLVAAYYDQADRLTETADFGTNVGDWSAGAAAPSASSANASVTKHGYDAAGNQNSITDPNGVTTLNVYDPLGRVTSMIENFVSGATQTNTVNVTTDYTYDGDNNLLTKTFYDVRPGGTPLAEETQYIYSSPFSNDLLQAVLPPTPTGANAGVPDSADETTYTYDALGDVLTTTEANGAVESTDYNALGEMASQTTTTTDGSGDPTVSYGYDDLGDVDSVTDAKGYITNYDYNSLGELLSVTQPDPGDGSGTPVTAYTYDNAGNVTSITDPDHAQTVYKYDLLNRLIEVDQPSAGGNTPVTAYSYNVNGVGNTVTDPNGATTESVLDAFGRVSETVQNLYNIEEGSYSPDVTATPVELTTSYAYDYDGNETSLTDANGDTTNFGYDALDRKTSQTTPNPTTGGAGVANGGLQTTWQYDAAGNVVATGDPLSNYTTYYYNTWNQVTEEIQPQPTTGGTGPNAAPTTSFTYDEMGNLQSLTDPDGNVTSYDYNQLNEKVSETDPAITVGRNQVSPVKLYLYDLNGNLTQMTDGDGNTTYFTYDHLNRLTGETWNNSSGVTTNTISYTYDKDGHLTGGSDDNSSTSLCYNALGELTSDSVTYDGIGTAVGLTLGYNADGNVTSLQASIGSTADLENLYTYDSLDRLTSMTQQGRSGGNAVAGKEVVFSYTNIGQVKTITRYAAASTSGAVVATTTNSYDHDDRLTGISTTLGSSGSTALNDTFGYDADGRITSENNTASGSGASSLTTDGAATLGYNNDNELTSVTPGTGSSIDAESYTYDAAGNRTSAQTGVESSSSSVTPGEDNEVSSDANYSYRYDADGNLTTRTNTANGDVEKYTWDNRDRLVEDQTKTGGGSVIQTVTYTYSPITNQRLSETIVNSTGTTTEYYVYEPNGNLLIVLNGSGNVKERDLTGLGLSEILATETGIAGNGAGTVEWALTNQVGSVTDVLSGTGTVIDHIRYDSFGNIESQTSAGSAMRFGYAGMQTDAATGLYYDNARYYDPQSGRFISQDPLSFRGGDYDLYRYAGDDSLNASDPAGTQVRPSNPSPDLPPFLSSGPPVDPYRQYFRTDEDLKNEALDYMKSNKEDPNLTYAMALKMKRDYYKNQAPTIRLVRDCKEISYIEETYEFIQDMRLEADWRHQEAEYAAWAAANPNKVHGIQDNTYFAMNNDPILVPGSADVYQATTQDGLLSGLLTAAGIGATNVLTALGSQPTGSSLPEQEQTYSLPLDDLEGNAGLATNWQEHEQNVTDNLRRLYPSVDIGSQVTLDVTHMTSGRTLRIRIDNLVPPVGTCPNYQLVDAKFSSTYDLSDTSFNLTKTVTKNQYSVYDWIASGAPVNVVPIGDNAESAGLTPGIPITVDPNVQIHVNGTGGIVNRPYK